MHSMSFNCKVEKNCARLKPSYPNVKIIVLQYSHPTKATRLHRVLDMRLKTAIYALQKDARPQSGRHILAQSDEETVVVYQAYQPGIGRWAAQNEFFGGDFSYGRMSWIKPNFLWMMFRSGWGSKAGQETTLAIWLRRDFFHRVLEQAVPSTFNAARYKNEEEWKKAVARSDVRLQWDPDHDSLGNSLQRRAVQLGLRGEVLREYGREAIVAIEDISVFVSQQRPHIADENRLLVAQEQVYLPPENIARQLGLSS